MQGTRRWNKGVAVAGRNRPRRAERPPYICSRLLAHHSDSSFLGPPYHVGRAAPTGKRQHQIGLAFLQHLLVALGPARTAKVHPVRILRGFNSALAGPVQGDRIGAGLTARDNHLRSQQVERRIDGFGVGVVPAAANDHAHFSALGRTSGIASVSRGPCSICLAALLPRSRSKRGATCPCYHNRFRNSRPSRTRPHRLFQFF